MNWRGWGKQQTRRRRNGAAYLVLAISLVPVFVVFMRSRDVVRLRDEQRFQEATQHVQAAIEDRMRHYLDALHGTRSLFHATGSVNREQWQRYIGSLNLRGSYLGIQGIAFAQRVPNSQRAAHEQTMRSQGFPGYQIRSYGTAGDLFPNVYVMPWNEEHQAALGFDVGAEPVRRTAMDRARDTGRAVTTERLTLVIDRGRPNPPPAFLIVLPVYDSDSVPQTLEERQRLLIGFVIGAFKAPDLFASIFAEGDLPPVNLEVFDGAKAETGNLLYHHVSQTAKHRRPLFTRDTLVKVAGRNWSLQFSSPPEFEARSASYLPWLVLTGGLAASGALFLITFLQAQARATAEQLTDDLRRSQERDRLIDRATNDVIWDWDVASNRLSWNEATQAMFGYAGDKIEPTLQWWSDRLHPDDRSRTLDGVRSAVNTGGEFWADEYRFLRGDGKYATVMHRGYIVRDHRGRGTRMIGSIVDLTERKRAEQVLAEEKELLAVTLRSIADAVITTDTDGKVTTFNNAAEELTGQTRQAVTGKLLTEVISVRDAKTGAPLLPSMSGLFANKDIFNFPLREGRFIRGGLSVPVAFSLAPLLHHNGDVAGAILIARDVSEEQRLTDERLRSSKLESLGILAGGIAHDFNNILTVVTGNLSFVRQQIDPQSPGAQRLEGAQKAAVRAKELTKQLLTFAKGGVPIKEATDLANLVREVSQFVIRGSNCKCEFSLPADLAAADADTSQLTQVIQNLVINAVQAMPSGGTIQISAENVTFEGNSSDALPSGKYVRFTVTDQGVGISAENLAKIFDPYFTTKETGTGLGLATAYSIVKRHGGAIRAESKEGAGAKFEVILPATERRPPSNDKTTGRSPSGSGRVLLMDDDQWIRTLGSSMLKHLGYQPITAEEGSEAVRLYEDALGTEERFVAVIMDLTVPGGLGGKDAVRELLQLDPEVCVIVSSGYSNDPVMANYREHGFRAMIAKPYTIEEIARVLREVLEGKPAE